MERKLGRVSYINSLPLFCAKSPFDVVSACPSDLNDLVAKGALEMSLISRWIYPRVEKHYRVLPQFCIAGDGEIMSVKMFSRVPLERLARKKISITSETGSSSRAFRHVVKMKYGFDIFALDNVAPSDADAILLIGNAALAFDRPEYGYVCDLGEIWKETMGKKMLYAVAVLRREIYGELAPALSEFFEKSLDSFGRNKEQNLLLAGDIFAKSQGVPIAREILNKYYSRLIYKLAPEDFRESFDCIAALTENERF